MSTARAEEPVRDRNGHLAGPAAEISEHPINRKARAVGSATGMMLPPYKSGVPCMYPRRTTKLMVVTSAAITPAKRRDFSSIRLLSAAVHNRKVRAVIGAIRPFLTAPNAPGFATKNSSIPRLEPAQDSINFVMANKATVPIHKIATRRTNPVCDREIMANPKSTKAAGVLGAMGI